MFNIFPSKSSFDGHHVIIKTNKYKIYLCLQKMMIKQSHRKFLKLFWWKRHRFCHMIIRHFLFNVSSLCFLLILLKAQNIFGTRQIVQDLIQYLPQKLIHLHMSLNFMICTIVIYHKMSQCYFLTCFRFTILQKSCYQ